MIMDDLQIIDMYWSRDEAAIAATAKKYNRLCRSIAGNILGEAAEVDECINDVYFHVWHAIPPQRPHHFKAWLCRITRNTALNRWHKDHAAMRGAGNIDLVIDELAECVPDSTGVEQIAEGKELVGLLNHWLQAQSIEHRVLFLRRYWYGMPLKDIAATLGEPANRTAQTLYRLRQNLKDYLDKEGY